MRIGRERSFLRFKVKELRSPRERLIFLSCGSMEAQWRIGNDDNLRHNVEELRAEQEAVEVKACEEGICWVHHQLVKEGRGETQGGKEQAVPRQCEVQ